MSLLFAEDTVFPFKYVNYTVNAYLQDIAIVAFFSGDLPAWCLRAGFGRTFFGCITVHNFPAWPIAFFSHLDTSL
jgi:hypothetical protein